MKSYTSLEQAKKLAKILSDKTADMCWERIYDEDHMLSDYRVELLPYRLYSGLGVPCWSLAALITVLPASTIDSSEGHYFRVHCQQKFSEWHDNPVDACYEMITRLNELNLL